MKEKFEMFKNEKTVINVRSKKQYDDFMKLCEEQGLKWDSGDLPTEQYYYNKHEEETCINLNNLKCLYHCDINFYKNVGYKIITYEDFIKEESNQFTKSNLRDNHIVKERRGLSRLWKEEKASYNENLTQQYSAEYDIMEVWEFDKLVWNREEQILDEVEKEYLANVINPWKNKIDTIRKEKKDNILETITILYDKKDNVRSYTTLPRFKKGTMYKGMEVDKEYSLKDLGLE